MLQFQILVTNEKFFPKFNEKNVNDKKIKNCYKIYRFNN